MSGIKKHLDIFKEGIIIDLGLPKFSESENHKFLEKEDEEKAMLVEAVEDNDLSRLNVTLSKNNIRSIGLSDMLMEDESSLKAGRFVIEEAHPNPVNYSKNRRSWFKKISDHFYRHGYKVETPVDYDDEDNKIYKLNIPEMFSGIKTLTSKAEETYRNRIGGYLKLIKNAEASGQKALRDRLVNNVIVAKYESLLYASGNYKAISEERAAEFIENTKKGDKVRVYYIKNYTRIIPEDVIELKKKADEMCIFDNYVIMCYDPDTNQSGMTEKEIEEERERKRDPILFGVIANSDKLYYIADWEDEYCDLKFEDIVDAFGEQEISRDYIKEDPKSYVRE